jgi:8-oxo-dGTP pyrophosphatase MutT (NUDIX family)
MNVSAQVDEQKTKQSYGLAVCKFIDGILHVLMVKKKYSYSFFEFVFGKYPRFDRVKLEAMFDSMTYQEKTDILEMDFDKLWCKIVLNVPDDPNSMGKSRTKLKRPTGKKRFELAFQDGVIETDLIEGPSHREKEWQTYVAKRQRFKDFIEDGGRRLRELINHSRSADPIWEIPKGRPDGDEKPIDAATREFTEETAGSPDNYKIIYDIQPIKINYINAKCLYRNEYFVAIANPNWIPAFQYNCYENNREVEELRWVSSNEVKFLNKNQHTYKRMINLLDIITRAIRPHRKLAKNYDQIYADDEKNNSSPDSDID